jgi:hypothetical protein
MSIYTFVGLLLSILLLTSFAIGKRNREEAYRLREFKKKDDAHIEEELMIHTALEEAGALPNHHHHHHGTHHVKANSQTIKIRMIINYIGYTVIAIELFFLYQMVRDII